MLEVFACEGEIELDASDDYREFEDPNRYNQIVLEQKNYGGHYVVNSEYVYGEYFVRVKDRGVKS